MAHDLARAAAGRFLLRIEDIDHTRSRPEWERQILEDLTWLGVTWDALPMRQSDRTQAYGAALQELWSRGLLYACSCTRRDIAAAVSAFAWTPSPARADVVFRATCSSLKGHRVNMDPNGKSNIEKWTPELYSAGPPPNGTGTLTFLSDSTDTGHIRVN